MPNGWPQIRQIYRLMLCPLTGSVSLGCFYREVEGDTHTPALRSGGRPGAGRWVPRWQLRDEGSAEQKGPLKGSLTDFWMHFPLGSGGPIHSIFPCSQVSQRICSGAEPGTGKDLTACFPS